MTKKTNFQAQKKEGINKLSPTSSLPCNCFKSSNPKEGKDWSAPETASIYEIHMKAYKNHLDRGDGS